jgi:hypothetical protein
MRYFYSLKEEKYSEIIDNSIDLAQELFFEHMKREIVELEYNIIDESDRFELVKRYLNRKISDYVKLDNVYKLAYESYKFSLNENTNEEYYHDMLNDNLLEKAMNEQDNREQEILHHIVKLMEAKLNEPFSNLQSKEHHLDYAEQMKEIANVMLETHIKEKMHDMAYGYLEILENNPEAYITFDNFGNLKLTEDSDEKLALKDMFNNPNNYDPIIELLIKKKLVVKTKNGLEIILPPKFQKKGGNFFMVAIAFRLREMDYVKRGGDDIDIVDAMNNTFDNCSLSKQNYSSFKDSPRQSEYFEAIKFIN